MFYKCCVQFEIWTKVHIMIQCLELVVAQLLMSLDRMLPGHVGCFCCNLLYQCVCNQRVIDQILFVKHYIFWWQFYPGVMSARFLYIQYGSTTRSQRICQNGHWLCLFTGLCDLMWCSNFTYCNWLYWCSFTSTCSSY